MLQTVSSYDTPDTYQVSYRDRSSRKDKAIRSRKALNEITNGKNPIHYKTERYQLPRDLKGICDPKLVKKVRLAIQLITDSDDSFTPLRNPFGYLTRETSGTKVKRKVTL